MWQPPERIKHALPSATWPSASDAKTSMLFSPIKVGPRSLSTRTWVPAMVPWRATQDGLVTDDVVDWYARFAKGKPGAIVVEATAIRDVPSGPLMRAGHDRFIPGLRRLVDAVKEASDGETSILIQLIDFLQVRRRPQPEKFFALFLVITTAHREKLDALDSGGRWKNRNDDEVRAHLGQASKQDLALILTARELDALERGYREEVGDTHLPHIRDLPHSLPPLFAKAAARVFQAGFDGVELHYAHAYTMASFLSARNHREDGYGGDREHRVRLPLEVLAAVREQVNGKQMLGLRFLGDEVIAGGSRLDDALYYTEQFCNSGVDFLSVSKGGKFEDAKTPRIGDAVYPYTGPSGYECMPTVFSDLQGPFGRNINLAAAVRQRARSAGHCTPIVTAGGIGTFELAEEILQRGEADIIASARQSIADPDWLLKARLGHGDSVRRCQYTNYCEGLDQKHKQVTCKLWDRKHLDQEGVTLDHSGRRRLTAPPWEPNAED